MASDSSVSFSNGLPVTIVFQRDPVQKLHHDEGLSVLLVNLMNSADVGMIQRRRCFGLALEPAQGLRVFGYFVGQELEGNKPAELHILSLIDHTHPATA